MDFKGKIIVFLIILTLGFSLIGIPSAIRRGKRSERQLELEAREDLSMKGFGDFFDGFIIYTRNQSYPFLYEYYDYLGSENNFTSIGTIVDIVSSESEGTLNFRISFNTDDLACYDITLFLAQDFNEQILSELSIMILGNGIISYYETDIVEDIVVDFNMSVTEISVIIF